MKLVLYKMAQAKPRHRSLPPLVCHPGAKHFSKKLILARMPEHRVYVEPFFGGGSVFFSKPPSEKEVISDKDKGLMGFYRRLNCRSLDRCVKNMIGVGTSSEKVRAKWRPYADRLAKGSSHTCDVWIGKTYGYGCKSGRPSFAPTKAKVHSGKTKILGGACQAYKERLKKAAILSGDYQSVMKRYDSKNTFFYLDPPWLGESNQKANKAMYRGDDTTSPESVCSFLKRIKGKFILHYDDNPRIRKACRGFLFERVPWRTSMQGGQKKKHALLISNFKPKKRRTGA